MTIKNVIFFRQVGVCPRPLSEQYSSRLLTARHELVISSASGRL